MFMFVTLNTSRLGKQTTRGSSVWQSVLIFDHNPLPKLTCSGWSKYILISIYRCVCILVFTCERGDAVLNQLWTRGKWGLHNSLLPSCYLWHCADTAVTDLTSAICRKRKQPPIYTFIHLRTVHLGQKLRKVGIKQSTNHVHLTHAIWSELGQKTTWGLVLVFRGV